MVITVSKVSLILVYALKMLEKNTERQFTIRVVDNIPTAKPSGSDIVNYVSFIRIMIPVCKLTPGLEEFNQGFCDSGQRY